MKVLYSLIYKMLFYTVRRYDKFWGIYAKLRDITLCWKTLRYIVGRSGAKFWDITLGFKTLR